jgi:hypothetical protein
MNTTTSEKPTPEGLRSLVAVLEQRLNRIKKVHRSRAVVLDSYALVAANLRAAASATSGAVETSA